MDFGTLLTVAQKNENVKQPIACYQTKFAPPKKSAKQAKNLSENIKKFLARKEEEEKQKVLEEKKKRENLLALRDHRAQSRISKHLKVCKAANKAVLEDAIDNENTAVTMAGPSQPDEDDYGYVSQEASAFYNQLMNKYNNAPAPKPLFNDSGKRTIKDIASTKDRVKQALKQQEIEEALGHRRKRKSTAKDTDAEPEEKVEKVEKIMEDEKKEKEEKPKHKKKPLPPPMDFNELLKIAEKKQHEPIVIDVKPKAEKPERLMTKKQMMEYTKEREWREKKEQRVKDGSVTNKEGNTAISNKSNKTQDCRNNNNKISKSSENNNNNNSNNNNKICVKAAPGTQPSSFKKSTEKPHENKSNASKSNNSRPSEKDVLLEERRKLEAEKRKLEEMRRSIEEEKKKLQLSKSKIHDVKHNTSEKCASKLKIPEQKIAPKSDRQKEPPASSTARPCTVPTTNGKVAKQVSPKDNKPVRSKLVLPSKEQKKSLVVHKRRIRDENEEEYDSELDDFIDDGVEDEAEDYSKYISEIFGYDKSKYKYVNNDDDDAAMESSFAQQLKEEYVSTKIGIMEDLEDMRMEALEKKRKALLKKKIKN